MPRQVTLSQVYTYDNLRRAWRWLLTSREAQYKNYFRHTYRAYALAIDENLAALRHRLRSGAYRPAHALKVYYPKPSGVLRPISLLTVEDQIVYQGFGNVIAEQLLRRVSHRYHQQIFGHLYAGKTSFTFYRDWRASYKGFTESIRSAYARGLVYTASFDLTACYDSIDHAVLKHFLRKLGLADEVGLELCSHLSRWTAASDDRPIYHGHGIPQGPLPSGLIAECVLQRLDRIPLSARERYFRYVDDIRLFARTEKAIRRRLVWLDRASKEIGLFPQSSKIEIHLITDIDSEVKGISHPPELGTPRRPATQSRIHRRLMALTRRLKVTDDTRFKFVLGQAQPRAALTRRLIRILDGQPHLFPAVCAYLAGAERLSEAASSEFLALLKTQNLYPAFTSGILKSLQRGFHSRHTRALASAARAFLKGGDADLRAAAGSTLLVLGSLTWAQTKYHVLESRSPFVRSWLIGFVDRDRVGEPSYEWLLNQLLYDEISDVALVAADLLLESGLGVRAPARRLNRSAQIVLRNGGLIGRVSSAALVADIISAVLGTAVRQINWRRIFGRHYTLALRKLARWQGYATTDPTAWVNLTDTMNDLIVDRLFDHEAGAIGSYRLGDVGAVLNSRSRFAQKYPIFFEAVRDTHTKRLQSDLSHAFLRTTGRATRRIEFKEVRWLQPKLRAGYLEVWAGW